MRSPSDYSSLFRALVDLGNDFAIIEHDIAIHRDVMPQLESCLNPWCVFPFSGGHELFYEGLGCARFRVKSLLSIIPDFSARIGDCRWSDLDTRVGTILKEAGVQFHTHLPPVLHFHHWEVPSGHLPGCKCPTCTWVRGVHP